MGGKSIGSKLLQKQIFFSVLNVKMQIKLKDVQASFLTNATSHCYSFSFSSLSFFIILFFFPFLRVYKTLVSPSSFNIGVQSSEIIFFLKKLLFCCY